MKNKLYHLVVFVFATVLFSVNLNAQHCVGASGPSVCTPMAGLTVMQFYPPDTVLPCAVVGSPYDTVVQIHTPTVAQGYTVNWIKILNVNNLPCGMCWRSNSTTNQINGNSTGCVRVTGTTYDAPGEYNMVVYADVNVTVGFFPITISDLNLDTAMRLHYYARVQLPGGTCAPVDTLVPGLTAHTAGAAPAITLAGNNSVCTGGSSTFSISNAASYYAYKWSTGEFTSSINVSTGGIYTVTAYANCSSVVGTRTLTVNPIPTPTITPSGSTTFCSGSSISLDAGAYNSYVWSTNATSQTINVSQAGNYTVTVTQNGCTGTSNTISVTVNSNPAPTVTAGGATTFCAGGSVTLDAGAGYAGYAWSGGGSNQTLSATQSGNYTCTVTQGGCSGTSNTISVTVNNNPTPTVNASGATTFCAGGNVTLDAGPGYSNYAWSNGGTNQTITTIQSGNYTCTVTQNGCSGTSNSVSVTVNPIPTPVITAWGATSFCLGGDVWLNATAGYDTYLWSNGTTGVSYTADETGSFDVTVTQNGCTGVSNAISVTVTDPTPTVTANGPTTFCTGGSVTLDAGAGFSVYAWSDATSNQTDVITQSGSYTVSTTLNGCVGVSTPVVVTVTSNNLAPVIIATPSLNICPGGSATLDAGVGYDTYTWSTTATNQSITENAAAVYEVTVTQGTCSGTASATLNVGNFPVAVNVSPAGPVSACTGDVVTLDAGGNYDTYLWSNSDATATTSVTASGSYIVTVTLNSCEGTDTVDVTFNSSLQPSISPAGPVNACIGDAVTLDAGTFAAYSWSNGAQGQTIQPTSSGSYAVTVTQNGCSGSDTVDVVFNAHPSVTITSAGPLTVCEGTAVTLDAGVGYDTYTWSNNDQTQTTQPGASGTYQVTVTANGCDGSASVSVTINSLPVPVVTPAGPVSACVGDNVVLDAGSGFSSYSWSNGDLTQTTQPTANGIYVVNVTQNGCSAADTVDVTFNAIPHAAITPSGTQTICSGKSVTLDAGAGYSSYQWTNNEATRTITVDSASTYDVTVTQSGCSGGSTSPVSVVVNAPPIASLTNSNITGDPENALTALPANAQSYIWQTSIGGAPFSTIETTSSNLDTAFCICALFGNPGNGSRSLDCWPVRVIVTTSGCSDTSNTEQPFCFGGVNDLKDIFNFNLQPNPTNELLTISYQLNSHSAVTLSVIDITGRKIMDILNETEMQGEHRHTINVGNLTAGVYLLNLTTAFGNLNSKFVKQ